MYFLLSGGLWLYHLVPLLGMTGYGVQQLLTMTGISSGEFVRVSYSKCMKGSIQLSQNSLLSIVFDK